jgi:hypothetical protein
MLMSFLIEIVCGFVFFKFVETSDLRNEAAWEGMLVVDLGTMVSIVVCEDGDLLVERSIFGCEIGRQ